MDISGVKLVLLRGDITRQDADTIVNAANSSLLGGGGVDGAIHRAGGPAILEECRKIRAAQGSCKAGDAVITGGGNLAARWVVHTVGPVWNGGTANEELTLANAYKNSLSRAMEVDAKVVAFPSVSTGAYGYPVDKAAAVALNAIKEFLAANQGKFTEIRFVLFDDRTFQAYEQAANSLL